MSMLSDRTDRKRNSPWFYPAMILILILVLLASKAKSQPPPIDTTKAVKVIVPADSINIISLADYNTFFKWLQENVSKAAYDKLTPDQVLTNFYQWAILRYNEKKKPK